MTAICITMLLCTVILGGFMIAAVDKLLSKKQGAQKPTIEMKSAEESLGIDSETYNKIVDECIYGDDKQNPTWREEDEHRINRLIAYFEDKESFTAEDDIVYANWLKSLKDRVQPQEWSKEDQNALEDVREAVVHYWGGDSQDILLYWLKSLKQRIKKEAV